MKRTGLLTNHYRSAQVKGSPIHLLPWLPPQLCPIVRTAQSTLSCSDYSLAAGRFQQLLCWLGGQPAQHNICPEQRSAGSHQMCLPPGWLRLWRLALPLRHPGQSGGLLHRDSSLRAGRHDHLPVCRCLRLRPQGRPFYWPLCYTAMSCRLLAVHQGSQYFSLCYTTPACRWLAVYQSSHWCHMLPTWSWTFIILPVWLTVLFNKNRYLVIKPETCLNPGDHAQQVNERHVLAVPHCCYCMQVITMEPITRRSRFILCVALGLGLGVELVCFHLLPECL